MRLKLFRATVANANTDSLKSLHTFFDMYLDYMLSKVEPNLTVQNVQNVSFWTKIRVLLKFNFDKSLTPFCKTFLWLKQLLDAKLVSSFRLPFFRVPKIMVTQHV